MHARKSQNAFQRCWDLAPVLLSSSRAGGFQNSQAVPLLPRPRPIHSITAISIRALFLTMFTPDFQWANIRSKSGQPIIQGVSGPLTDVIRPDHIIISRLEGIIDSVTSVALCLRIHECHPEVALAKIQGLPLPPAVGSDWLKLVQRHMRIIKSTTPQATELNFVNQDLLTKYQQDPPGHCRQKLTQAGVCRVYHV